MSDRLFGRAPGWVWPVVGAVVLAVLPWIFTSAFLRATLVRFTIALLLLTGLNFIAGYAGMISLAQAGLYGVGGYAAGILSTSYGVPPLLAFVLAPLVAVLVAIPVGVPSLRLRGLYFVMATLGAGVVLFLLFGRLVDLTGGPNGLVGVPQLSVAGISLSSELRLYYVGATLAFAGLLAAGNLQRSRTGRALQALGVSEPGALVAGVPVFRLRLVAFLLSAAYAGAAGALLVFESRFISPSTFDFLEAVLLLVMLTVGGLGTTIGPIIGAVLLIALETGLQNYAEFQPLIIGIVFVISIQILPQGIGGLLRGRGRSADALPAGADPAQASGGHS